MTTICETCKRPFIVNSRVYKAIRDDLPIICDLCHFLKNIFGEQSFNEAVNQEITYN